MAIIKNLAFLNRFKFGKNLASKDFPPFAIDFLHYFLPLGMKFLTDFFAAVDEKGKLVGLIGLQPVRQNSKKIKITNFFLEENSFEIGEQLINYALLKYCTMGAGSFFINIDENLDDMRALFVKNCNFRVCSKESVFAIEQNKMQSCDHGAFKPHRSSGDKQLLELYNDCVNAQYKYYFSKNLVEFKNEFIDVGFEKASFKFVVENEERGETYGFFSITTSDNTNYILDFFLSNAVTYYFDDIIDFVHKQISKRTKKYNLYVKIKNYYYNSKELLEFASQNDFKTVQSNVVLTKDFLNLAQEHSAIQNTRIIFNDITPAFKTFKTFEVPAQVQQFSHPKLQE